MLLARRSKVEGGGSLSDPVCRSYQSRALQGPTHARALFCIRE